ncbi:MAG: hypothetical protein ACPG4T_07590 [Nannocystaceae bacterium]
MNRVADVEASVQELKEMVISLMSEFRTHVIRNSPKGQESEAPKSQEPEAVAEAPKSQEPKAPKSQEPTPEPETPKGSETETALELASQPPSEATETAPSEATETEPSEATETALSEATETEPSEATETDPAEPSPAPRATAETAALSERVANIEVGLRKFEESFASFTAEIREGFSKLAKRQDTSSRPAKTPQPSTTRIPLPRTKPEPARSQRSKPARSKPTRSKPLFSKNARSKPARSLARSLAHARAKPAQVKPTLEKVLPSLRKHAVVSVEQQTYGAPPQPPSDPRPSAEHYLPSQLWQQDARSNAPDPNLPPQPPNRATSAPQTGSQAPRAAAAPPPSDPRVDALQAQIAALQSEFNNGLGALKNALNASANASRSVPGTSQGPVTGSANSSSSGLREDDLFFRELQSQLTRELIGESVRNLMADASKQKPQTDGFWSQVKPAQVVHLLQFFISHFKTPSEGMN